MISISITIILATVITKLLNNKDKNKNQQIDTDSVLDDTSKYAKNYY
jgi:hypothetical protein